MITLIIAFAAVIYVAGFVVTARRLFAAWRPSRVPLCNEKNHYEGNDKSKALGLFHGDRCYRRRRADLSILPFNTDAQATKRAAGYGTVWPAVAVAALIRGGAPEFDAEKDARLRKLREETARMQADLDAERNRLS